MNIVQQEKFAKRLSSLISEFCYDAELGAPDYIIAGYLVRALNSYVVLANELKVWLGPNRLHK